MKCGMAYDHGEVDLQAKIKVPHRRRKTSSTTTVGRALLKDICPKEIPFEAINKVMGKKQLAELIDLVYREAGQKATVLLADALRTTGYTYATNAGISIGIDDMVIPPSKEVLLDEAQKEVAEIEDQYTEGLITDGERYNKVVDIWAQVAEQIAKEMMSEIGSEEIEERGHRRGEEDRRRSTRSSSWPTRAPAAPRSRSASWPACAA